MDYTLLDERLLAEQYKEPDAPAAPQPSATSGTVAADPGNIAAQTRGSVDVTIAGVAPGDIVIMNPPDGLNAGLAFAGCRVTAANTVRIYLSNLTGAGIDDGSLNWDFFWIDLT